MHPVRGHPDHPPSWRIRGRRLALGLPAGAAALIVLALLAPSAARAQPQAVEATVFVGRAVVAYDEQRWADVLTAAQEALRLDPKNTDALYYSGLAYIKLRRFDDAVRVLEQARALTPRDAAVQFQLGALYFGLGRYDQAEPLLEAVFAADPRLDSAGYYVGFMRYRKKDYQGALRAFRAGATSDADIRQLTRFYSGLALGVLGLPQQAAAEIDEALRLVPASPLTGPAERLRNAVTAAAGGERRFHIEVRAGFIYDDNVPVNPRPSSRDPLVESLRQRQQRSLGEVAAVKLDYAFLRLGAFDATVTYSFFTTYSNDLPDFSIVDHLGGLGLGYRGEVAGIPYQLGLQYAYDYLTLGGPEFAQRHTVTPSGVVSWNSSHLTALQLRIQTKQFSDDTDVAREDKRDGVNYLAGFVHFFRLAGDKHLLKVGYQLDAEDTDGSDGRGRNHAYTGHRVLAGAQYTLPWLAMRLRYDFDVHLRDYRHRHTLLPVLAPNTRERTDTEYTHVLGLTVPLPRNLSLSADYQATVARSNIDAFTYTRRVFSLLVGWSY